MDMPERLLLPVLANPEDDSPRLIAADWWDENGECERAEFVRVQCALARNFMPGDVPDPDVEPIYGGRMAKAYARHAYHKWKTLTIRERELLDAHWAAWLHQAFDPLAPDVGCATNGHDLRVSLYGAKPRTEELGSFRCEFRRGFAASVACSWDAWERHGPAIVRCQPIEEVRLAGLRPERSADRTRDGWGWFRGDLTFDPEDVPEELFVLIQGGLPWISPRRGVEVWMDYPTEADALCALSDAALLWARRKAWPCGECGGRGRVAEIGWTTSATDLRRSAPHPTDLALRLAACGQGTCPACGGRGWRVRA